MHVEFGPHGQDYVVDFAYLLRTSDGSVHVEHDRHAEGLFRRDEWMRWLADTGSSPRVVPFEHSELEPGSYEVVRSCAPSGGGYLKEF